MPTIRFVGSVFPLESNVTMGSVYAMKWTEPPTTLVPTGLDMAFQIRIEHSAVEVICDLNHFENSNHLETARCRALDLTKALVNLYCFSEGVGLSVRIDKFFDPSNQEKTILMLHPTLRQYCTAFDTRPNSSGLAEYDSVLILAVKEFEVCMAIDELISAISTNHRIPVACGSAIEGLRKVMAKGIEDRGEQWGIFQTNLNITKRYRQYITDQSADPRHGDRSHIEAHLLTETLNRSWVITNRFLEYLKRGSTPLTDPEFPLLDA